MCCARCRPRATILGLRELLEARLEDALDDGWSGCRRGLRDVGTQRDALWRLRESIPEAQRREGASIKHDVAVPVAAYLRS